MLDWLISKVSPHLPVAGATIYGSTLLIALAGAFSVTIEIIKWKREASIKKMELDFEEKKLGLH